MKQILILSLFVVFFLTPEFYVSGQDPAKKDSSQVKPDSSISRFFEMSEADIEKEITALDNYKKNLEIELYGTMAKIQMLNEMKKRAKEKK